AGEQGVVLVQLLVRLGAGELDPAGVEHDHEVAHVHVRRVRGLVLAAEHQGDPRGETTQRMAGRIDHVPLSLRLAGLFGEPGALLCRHHGRYSKCDRLQDRETPVKCAARGRLPTEELQCSAGGTTRIILTARPGTSRTWASS